MSHQTYEDAIADKRAEGERRRRKMSDDRTSEFARLLETTPNLDLDMEKIDDARNAPTKRAYVASAAQELADILANAERERVASGRRVAGKPRG